jgi:hypothetical protein
MHLRTWICSILAGALVLAAFFSFTHTTTPWYIADMAACDTYQTADPYTDRDPVGTCYRAVITDALTDTTPREFLLKLFEYDSDETFKKQCHKIEHIIAQVQYEQTQNLEETIRSCSVVGCGNGCAHGAIAAHMQAELGPSFDAEAAVHRGKDELPNLSKHLCELGPSLCHGVGHVLVMQGNDMDNALALCRSIAGSRALGDCYSGVFMEYAQGFSAFTYRRPLKGETYYADKMFSCERFTGLLQHMCFVHFPSHVRMVLAEQGIPRAKLHQESYPICARLRDGEPRDSCFFGIGNTDGSHEECAFAPAERDKLFCAMGVGLFFKNPRKERVAYCESLSEPAMQEVCMQRFNELYVEAPQTGIGSESVQK